ncbi:uncharacterized protein LOC114314360 isoform X2 [Camellia sinensis]|uniref:uncharacterized protein LOC114314360 isoform X2 n=1 Tax=Camellia sinensis TaxID=4442 RepID=UPI0010360F1E|nr:uncharacterized protein LOC114314360 isoform X2 [Camellia sinensis]
MNNDLVRTRESLLEEQEARTRKQNRQRQRAYCSRLTNERRQEILQQRRENRQRAKEQQLRNKMIENDKDVPSTVVAPTENFYYGSCSSGGIAASSESNDFPIRTMEEKAIMIRELSYRSHKWRAKLRVIQKQPPRTTKLGTTTIQQFILTDSEGSRIQATCFDDDIPCLMAYSMYTRHYFSNGIIKYIDPRNRIIDNTIQLMLNSRISVEETESTEEANALETYFFIQLADASDYITTNIKFDIAAIATNVLPTRTITKRIDGQPAKVREIFLIDQSQLANPEKIEEIANSKHLFLLPSPTSSSKTFEVVPINNLSSHDGNIWIKGKITAEPITQRPWYVACNKCNRSTMGDIGTSFTCIECNTEESTATARSILRIQIKDNSGCFQTAIFGPHAEKLVGHSADALVQLNLRERMQKIADINMASKEKEYYIHLAPTKNASSTWANNKWTV